MPNDARNQPVFLQSGDPESESNATLYAPGQLGVRFTVKQPTSSTPGVESGRDKTYQVVRTDSTMTVSPYRGAVAWWADKAKYLVTTAATNRNSIAGVFQNAPVLGHYTTVQVQGPGEVKFIDAVTSPPNTAGRIVIPSATAAKADCLAVGTAPTHRILGEVHLTPTYNAVEMTAVVELDVPETP